MNAHAVHVTDPNANLGPFPSIEAAIMAVREVGAHVLYVDGLRVVFSDYPRVQPVQSELLQAPTISISMLQDRTGRP